MVDFAQRVCFSLVTSVAGLRRLEGTSLLFLSSSSPLVSPTPRTTPHPEANFRTTWQPCVVTLHTTLASIRLLLNKQELGPVSEKDSSVHSSSDIKNTLASMDFGGAAPMGAVHNAGNVDLMSWYVFFTKQCRLLLYRLSEAMLVPLFFFINPCKSHLECLSLTRFFLLY